MNYALAPQEQARLFSLDDVISRDQANPFSQILQSIDLLPLFDPNGMDRRYHRNLTNDRTVRDYRVSLDGHDIHLQITAALIQIPKEERYVDEDGRERSRRIKAADGQTEMEWVHVFPGLLEDKVDKALRKLMVHGRGHFQADHTGISFSHTELRNELHRTGATYNSSEINEALKVLRGAKLVLRVDKTTKAEVDSNFIETLVTLDREELDAEGVQCTERYQYIKFNPLVTRAVAAYRFRMGNHDRHAQLVNRLARHLSMTLMLEYTYAEENGRPFSVHLKQVFASACRPLSKRLDNDKRVMDRALQELHEVGMIAPPQRGTRERDRQTGQGWDYRYDLLATREFAEEMRYANAILKRNRAQLDQPEISLLQGTAPSQPTQSPLERALLERGVFATKVRELLGAYSEDHLWDCIVRYDDQVRTRGRGYNAGWLVSLIERLERTPPVVERLAESAELPALEGLTPVQQRFLQERFAHLSRGDQDNIRARGFASPYIQELLRQFELELAGF